MKPLMHGHLPPPRQQYPQRKVWRVAAATCVCYLASVSSALTKELSANDGDARRNELEEVIVTAQKRAERLQDVPISITVLTGEELDSSRAEGVSEALMRVPGVTTNVSFLGGGTQVAVRGVTAGSALFGGSSPIAYYLDSVPFGLVKTAIAPDSSAYDLERVEVLRGPQGTLYGASAQNGVVRILTNDADPNAFELKARTSISTTQDGGENYRGDMALNVPIVEGKLAARAVVGYEDLSGWVDRPNRSNANDAELRNGRLKLNAQPTENLSIGLSGWLSRSDYGAPPVSDDQGHHSSLADESIATDYDAYSLKVGYEFSGFSISLMTGYLRYENDSSLDLTPTGFPASLFTGFDATVFSQEIILSSSTDGPWRWSGGVSYRDAEDRLIQSIAILSSKTDWKDGSESAAVFGELSRRFLDNKLEWTLGLRYFKDDVFSKQNTLDSGEVGVPLHHDKDSFDSTTPRAVLTWYPSSSVTVYGSYSEGFRSGSLQYASVAKQYPDFPAARPDKLRNYEIGAKANLFGRLFSFDTAIYYIDWRDVQQTLSVPVTIGGNADAYVAALVNGKSASGVGIDLAVTARLLDGLELGGNVGWNDLAMDSAVFSGGALLFNRGDRLNYSAEYTLGAFAGYVLPLGRNGFECRFSSSANYSSTQAYRALRGTAGFVDTGDAMLIARASFSLNSPDRWSATIYADNINNEKGAFVGFLGLADWRSRVRPRTIGVQFEYEF
jgi:iron complex outermembrane recepter protein